MRHTLDKFMNDKAFVETDKLIIIVEGYLLNKAELFGAYAADSVASLAEQMYYHNGEQFFSEFRGAFSGVLYDKSKKVWLVFTNQSGDNALFYSYADTQFFAGSQVNYVIDACKAVKWPLTFDEEAAYQMLTFAFMADDSTYAKEIKRLRGGTYLRISEAGVELKEYHRFEKHPDRFSGKTEDELIEEIDKSFRYAVELEYRKDEEYGYRHLTDMSGGLDSRMNAWVAHSIKPRHLQLITYCKANYLDELISKEIANYWKDELLAKTLDDASFLYDIDEIVALNGGLSLYSGITGGKRMLESLNTEQYGLEHTGMIGDVVIGSFCRDYTDIKHQWPTGMYSEHFSERLNKTRFQYQDSYYDHEIYLIYSRGFQGAGNTIQIRKNFTEVAAPFMYPEFLQLCLDIPVGLRAQHKLYKKWIIAKYPDASAFRWEKTQGKITEKGLTAGLRKLVTHGPNKLCRMLGKASKISTGMNPLDYFIAHNKDLFDYLNNYAHEGFERLPKSISKQLVEDMRKLYYTGTVNEKTMVLTVLSSVKYYFGGL